MKIAFLTSNTPHYGNARAGSSVQLALALSAAKLGHSISIYLCNASSCVTENTKRLLDSMSITLYEQGNLFPVNQAFEPYPSRVRLKHIASDINDRSYDKVILFWDSKYEFIIPHINTIRVGYLAQPICHAWLTVLAKSLGDTSITAHHNQDSDLNIEQQINKVMTLPESNTKKHVLNALLQQYKHIKNLQHLDNAYCISRSSSQWYTKHGILSCYLPNCWPYYSQEASVNDFIKSGYWYPQESSAALQMGASNRTRILANVGRIDTHTGNIQGLDYLRDHILPNLIKEVEKGALELIIPGAGQPLDQHKSILSDPFVRYVGFVPRFERVLSKSHALLILNNTGIYSAGWTRCMVAMSRSMPIIAHKSLQAETPELNNTNCYLFNDLREVLDILRELANADQTILARYNQIAQASLSTYRCFFEPTVIVSKLLS